jgi:dUTP pyrophosphatase
MKKFLKKIGNKIDKLFGTDADSNNALTGIKLLSPLAKVPTRGSEYSAGYDLYSTEELDIFPNERKLIKTDISLDIPNGLYCRIAPRSGLAFKNGLDVLAGVIDEDFSGNIGVILINHGDKTFHINVGDRIAQIIFENYTPVTFNIIKESKNTNRGTNGFGSTGISDNNPIKNKIIPFQKQTIDQEFKELNDYMNLIIKK